MPAHPVRPTFADKQALLDSGKPWLVHPREVAKCTSAFDTDPEILLGCIVVSDTLDTARVLKAIINLDAGIGLERAEEEAYQRFRRVWQNPTPAERQKVLKWADALVQRPGYAWRWTSPA